MKSRVIELSANNRHEVLTLIVNPPQLEFTDPQNNEQTTLLEVGSINLLGERGLITTQIQSFFPSNVSPFYKRYNGNRTPEESKNLVKKWKDNKTIIRLIVSDMDINLAMSIDSFTYSKKEGIQDIDFTITLTEYRTLNVPAVKVDTTVKSSITKRPSVSSASSSSSGSPASSGKTYTIKSGDTLWAISSRYYGKGSQYMKIYNANSAVIEQEAKRRGKKGSSNGHWIWAGTVLTIP